MIQSVLFSWSGGKDSAMALHELRKDKSYRICALLTTVTQDYDRISIHGVRRVLLEQQAASLGYPLETVLISKNASNEEYDAKMKEVLERNHQAGVSAVAFGDIYLEDLRKYREANLSKIGMKAVFPIWKRDTTELARSFLKLGFKSVTTCIDSQVLDKAFVGRHFDAQFLSELPASIDPCGENGEFHSFVFDGPIFKTAVSIDLGEVVLRDNRFYFCDVISV